MNQSAVAVARSNIALVKYWGKSARGGNLTAVPSLSLTLDALRTTTRVRFDAALASDVVRIGGASAEGRPRERVITLLDELRVRTNIALRAEVVSENDFPTASGLASSASGFAALAHAAQAALGLGLDAREVSRIARRASASAARSIYGGFVELRADAESAEPVVAPDFWDLRMVIAATTLGPKTTASTDGMLHTQATSPYYAAWVSAAPALFEQAKQALLARDLPSLGDAMEQSTLMMHACMLAARPSLLYWRDATLRVVERVRWLRANGLAAHFTMDAGPHVKVLTTRDDASEVAAELAAIPGVERVLTSGPGGGVELAERSA